MSVAIRYKYRGQERLIQLPKPEGAGTPQKLLPFAREVTDTVIESMVQIQAEAGEPVSCRDGCAACCRYLVGVSPWEALELQAYVRGMMGDERAELQARFATALQKLESAGLLDRVRRAQTLSVDDVHALSMEYPQAGVPCPFLVNESCSIYEKRPLACRQLVVISPPEECAKPPYEAIEVLRPPFNMKTAMRALTAPKRENPPPIPLVLLLEWKPDQQTPEGKLETWAFELLVKADPRYFE